MSMKYLLLNYFTNNFFYLNGTGQTYDERTQDTINQLENSAEIEGLVEKINTWYTQNKNSIDGILKVAGVSSKSLDSFSISYSSEYQQSLINLLPMDIYLALLALGLWNVQVNATSGGYLW